MKYSKHQLINIFLSVLVLYLSGCSGPRLKLLIIDGQNNHDWQATTKTMKSALAKSGRFDVDVATTPADETPDKDWDNFRPDFAQYDVVLSNYNNYIPRNKGDRWPKEVEDSLEKFVSGGGGLVVIHAANNAFSEWEQWNRMIGLGWRHNTFGDRIYLDDAGNTVRVPKGEGNHASHGTVHEYKVTVRDPQHPIMEGMPTKWMHAADELYHSQRGPALNMHILASAYSSKESKGTEKHEPLVWVIPYGKGRVFTMLLGHNTLLGNNMKEEDTAIRCVGFQTLLCRGSEWAATRRVTIDIPKNFPTASEARLVDDTE